MEVVSILVYTFLASVSVGFLVYLYSNKRKKDLFEDLEPYDLGDEWAAQVTPLASNDTRFVAPAKRKKTTTVKKKTKSKKNLTKKKK